MAMYMPSNFYAHQPIRFWVESFCQKILKRTLNKSPTITEVTCCRIIQSRNQPCTSASFLLLFMPKRWKKPWGRRWVEIKIKLFKQKWAYFSHILCAVAAECSFWCFFFFLLKRISSLKCPKVTKIRPFLFIPHVHTASKICPDI